jgi:hypothetical protein
MKTNKKLTKKRRRSIRGGGGFLSSIFGTKPETPTKPEALVTPVSKPQGLTPDIQNYVNEEMKKLRDELNKTIDTKLNGKANKTLVQT